MSGRRLVARSIALVSTLAVLAAPAGSRTPPPSENPPSPVRCQIAADAGQWSSHQTYRHNVPSPPPPPAVGLAQQQTVVTGQAQSQQVASEALGKAARRPGPPGMILPYPGPRTEDRERYDGKTVSSVKSVAQEPVSTFSVDVDTGSYANVRRFLSQGQTPPEAAVRTEEMLNYFRYDYPVPADRTRPFSVTTDMAVTPWNAETRLLRIGIKGFDIPRNERPPANLVFLVDVSGSMMSQDKLPLVKTSLAMLADRLGPRDRVSIVVYAGAAGIVLEPTANPAYVKAALECLQAGGSTAGGQGMELAYATARAGFIRGGVNRVIMATDGDFNVGISSNEGIEAIVKRNRETGITLTTLGFGQGNYNEAMMERVADVGNGNYAYIDTAMEAQKVLDEEMAATLFTIAKDVKIQIEFNPAHIREYRLIGYENRALAEQDFDNDAVDAGDIGAGHQVTALYEVVPANGRGWLPDRRYEANRTAGPGGFSATPELAWLKLRYKLPDGEKSMLIEQPVPVRLAMAARAPEGDMAFACAVAAFGQKLRGDTQLARFGFSDIRKLAGSPKGYLREEFLKLASLAEASTGASGTVSGLE